MIKRTIYFGNPAYLSIKHRQLCINIPETEEVRTIPVEDIGIVVLDNPQITITYNLIQALLENNVALITCDTTHHPSGLMLPLESNVLQSERFQAQVRASDALKNNLWQQTIIAKIKNQGAVLQELGIDHKPMMQWAKRVKSGDSDNLEARAAAYYWQNIFEQEPSFRRERFGEFPNSFFNYSYSILRALTSRALMGSGLLPTLGIFHKSRYNAYCLADDIMEPYRPYCDRLVIKAINTYPGVETLTKDIKAILLSLTVVDVVMDKKRKPLQIAMNLTTSSLSKCFSGERRLIKYPMLDV